jgi:catechol 2,3-dioxygenase-like lactoylglutathione lyase family enzyme
MGRLVMRSLTTKLRGRRGGPGVAPYGLLAVMLLALATPIALRPLPAWAAPVPEAERSPIDVRRVTLLVRDIDKSLPLYRDALGLRVVYDQLIGGGTDASGKTTPPTVRLVLLRANDDFVGLIGLMQRLNVATPAPEPVFEKAKVGGHILVINVADLESRFERVRNTPHVRVAEAPTPVDYPSPDGKGKIPVLFSAVWDADGNFIELNKILGTPAGR